MASLRPALSPQGFFALMVAKLKLAIAPNRFAFFGCGIAYLCQKGEDTLLRMHDGRVFIFWESLDIAERQLDPALFAGLAEHSLLTEKRLIAGKDKLIEDYCWKFSPKTASLSRSAGTRQRKLLAVTC